MFSSGVRIGLATIRKKTWLIRKDRKTEKGECCVAVRGALFLRVAARPVVTGAVLASVAITAVSVFASVRTDYALLFVLLPFAL